MIALIQTWLVTHGRRRLLVALRRGQKPLEHPATVEAAGVMRHMTVKGKFSSGLVRQAVREFLRLERESTEAPKPSTEPTAVRSKPAELVDRLPNVAPLAPRRAYPVADARPRSRAAGPAPTGTAPAARRYDRTTTTDRMTAAAGGDD